VGAITEAEWRYKLQRLADLGIRLIDIHPEDYPGIVNAPAIAVPCDTMICGGGGLHCSTAPLIGDEV
jgi:hypothetical protein